MNFTLQVDQAAVRSLADRFGAAPAQLRQAATRVLSIKGQQAEERIKRAIRDQFDIRTGSMMGSIGYDLRADVTGWPQVEIGAIYQPPPHLAVQEYGKTIQGKPWLTVPIEHPKNPMLSQSRGASKGGAGGVFARDIRDSPGQFGFRGTFVAHGVIFGVPEGFVGKRGAGLGGGRGWNIVPIAVLKRSVTIPARPFLTPVFEQIAREIPNELEATLFDQMTRIVE